MASVNITVDVEEDVSADDWFDAADDDEKDRMAELIGDYKIPDIDVDVRLALIKYLENNQLKGISKYKQHEFVSQLYDMK